MQVVGRACEECGKKLASADAGTGCDECDLAWHHGCLASMAAEYRERERARSTCPRCGEVFGARARAEASAEDALSARRRSRGKWIFATAATVVLAFSLYSLVVDVLANDDRQAVSAFVRVGLTGLLLYYAWAGARWARVFLGVLSVLATVTAAIFAVATTAGPMARVVLGGGAVAYGLVAFALLVSSAVRAYLESNARGRA